MKPKLLILFFFTTLIFLQSHSQKMSYIKRGAIMFENKIIVKPSQIYPIISNIESPELLSTFHKFKTNRSVSLALTYIGGFEIGYSIGTALKGGNVEPLVLGSGIGFVIVALIFDKAANTNLKKMIDLYNGINSNKFSFQPFFKTEFGVTNLGLLVKF